MYKHETFIAVVNTDLSEETGLKVELLVLHFSISIAKQIFQFQPDPIILHKLGEVQPHPTRPKVPPGLRLAKLWIGLVWASIKVSIQPYVRLHLGYAFWVMWPNLNLNGRKESDSEKPLFDYDRALFCRHPFNCEFRCKQEKVGCKYEPVELKPRAHLIDYVIQGTQSCSNLLVASCHVVFEWCRFETRTMVFCNLLNS